MDEKDIPVMFVCHHNCDDGGDIGDGGDGDFNDDGGGGNYAIWWQR